MQGGVFVTQRLRVNHDLQEVDKRSNAIRKCGAEILKLRKHIEEHDKERSRLEGQLKVLHRNKAEAEMVSDEFNAGSEMRPTKFCQRYSSPTMYMFSSTRRPLPYP